MYAVGTILQQIVSSIMVDRPVPPEVGIPMSFVFPSYATNIIMRMIFNFENVHDGMTWSNLGMENEKQRPVWMMLTLLASITFYLIITVWAWPLRMNNDGSRLSPCYCLVPSYWRAKN